jgi:hypothetical protein
VAAASKVGSVPTMVVMAAFKADDDAGAACWEALPPG